jgi:hypothetical protein
MEHAPIPKVSDWYVMNRDTFYGVKMEIHIMRDVYQRDGKIGITGIAVQHLNRHGMDVMHLLHDEVIEYVIMDHKRDFALQGTDK